MKVLKRALIVVLSLAMLAVAAIAVAAHFAMAAGEAPMGAEQKAVTSRDGTRIAYEKSGVGPVLVLVSAALADRNGTRRLATHLSSHFTVINYDRRGRGASTDTPPYSPDKEVEDIQALIEANGGSAFVFGSSSGSVLALDAANELGAKIRKLFMFEPPFIVDNSRPRMADNLGQEISALVAQDRRNDAVKLFFTKGIGIPGPGVTLMRFLMPGWSKMTAMAQTAPYDLAVLSGTQTGQPLPPKRWSSIQAPVLVAVGGRSEPFFHSGAKALTEILPHAEYRLLKGMNHGAVLLSSKALGQEVSEYFQESK